MPLLDSIGRLFETAAPSARESYTLPTAEYFTAPKTGNDSQQLNAYESWIYAALTVRAKGVGAAKLRLYNPGGEEVESHPFLDLWQKPCDAWHGYPFRVVVALHLYLSGNAYWWMPDNGLRVPAALWPLRPDLTEVIPGKKREDGTTRFIDGYRFNGARGQVEFPVEQVVQIKLPNPYSNYYGMGVVEAARRAVDINRSIHDYTIASFRNNAVPKAVYRMSKDATPDQVAGITAMIEDAYKGVANAGRSGVITNALEDVKLLSMSPADMDYLAGAGFSRDQIFALAGVHRSKAGMADDINRANAEAADYTFSKDVVAPDLMLFEDAINSDILPRYGSKVVARFDDVVPEDRDRDTNEANIAWTTGLARRDEARVKLGLDELGGSEGEVFSVPFSVNLSNATPEPRLRSVPAAASMERARFTGQARAVGTVIAKHEAQIRAAMESYFRAQKKQVTGRLRNELARWPVETARAGVNEQEERDRLFDLLYPLLLAAALAGTDYVKRLTGKDIPRGPDAIAKDRARFVAETVTATTVAALIRAIEAAGNKAEALEAVESVFDRALGQRAPLIGRVEASTMVNKAAADGLREVGFAYKQWQTVGDDRVEEFCQANEDAGAIPMDERFPETGDYEPPTAEHPGCRCVLVPAMAEDVGVTPVDVEDLLGEAARL